MQVREYTGCHLLCGRQVHENKGTLGGGQYIVVQLASGSSIKMFDHGRFD